MTVALPVAIIAFAAIVAMTPENLLSHRFPNRHTLLAVAATSAALAITAIVAGDGWLAFRGVAGGVAMMLVLLAACVAWPAGVGFGMVKLAPVPGIAAGALGLLPWLVALVATHLGMLAWAFVVRRSGGSAVPAAPGFLLAILAAALTAAL